MHDPDRRFCAMTEDELADVTTACRWPMPSITIFQELQILDPTTCNRVLQRICTAWNATANINLHVVTTAAGSNIHTTSGQIDGLNGVLGQSYLPCGNISSAAQLQQLLDNGEHWTEDMLFRVWLHEVGHALGLEHAPQGSGAIMEPYLTALEAPQAEDIQQMQARYGAPIPVPAPTPLPPTVPIPSPAPVPSASPLMINIPAPGIYLVQISFAATKGSAVIRVAHPGNYPVTLDVTRR